MNSDDREADPLSQGTIKPAELVKAGCGVRYDPEALSAETGFDFSAAQYLLKQVRDEATSTDSDVAADSDHRA